jgi:hypothetical protein
MHSGLYFIVPLSLISLLSPRLIMMLIFHSTKKSFQFMYMTSKRWKNYLWKIIEQSQLISLVQQTYFIRTCFNKHIQARFIWQFGHKGTITNHEQAKQRVMNNGCWTLHVRLAPSLLLKAKGVFLWDLNFSRRHFCVPFSLNSGLFERQISSKFIWMWTFAGKKQTSKLKKN